MEWKGKVRYSVICMHGCMYFLADCNLFVRLYLPILLSVSILFSISIFDIFPFSQSDMI